MFIDKVIWGKFFIKFINFGGIILLYVEQLYLKM
jgi:hypothetical protein